MIYGVWLWCIIVFLIIWYEDTCQVFMYIVHHMYIWYQYVSLELIYCGCIKFGDLQHLYNIFFVIPQTISRTPLAEHDPVFLLSAWFVPYGDNTIHKAGPVTNLSAIYLLQMPIDEPYLCIRRNDRCHVVQEWSASKLENYTKLPKALCWPLNNYALFGSLSSNDYIDLTRRLLNRGLQIINVYFYFLSFLSTEMAWIVVSYLVKDQHILMFHNHWHSHWGTYFAKCIA